MRQMKADKVVNVTMYDMPGIEHQFQQEKSKNYEIFIWCPYGE